MAALGSAAHGSAIFPVLMHLCLRTLLCRPLLQVKTPLSVKYHSSTPSEEVSTAPACTVLTT